MNRRKMFTTLAVAVAMLISAGWMASWGASVEPLRGSASAQSSGPDDTWLRIMADGKILVGTSPDYPPFEYYDDAFQLDGFDIALMDAVAKKLGIQVEYKDFVFDGLTSALLLKQVDALIAALTITPERQAVMAFSNVYYVGEDAILARQGSNIVSVRSVNDMANLRVGVERGSVYETWLRDSLVNPGLTPAGNLFSYLRMEDAIGDLQEERVDLVVLDLLPARVAAKQVGVRLVGQGLNQQLLAIAMPKGASTLKAKIDEALTQLQNEGRIAQLAKEHLNIESGAILPDLTPTPTPCLDGMAWVQDLNYDDKGMKAPPVLKPGQGFVKGWRVKNSGSCAWDGSYSLRFAQGARMSGEPVPITRRVQPGDTYDLKVNLIAPKKPGTYQGFWNMVNGEGKDFGQRIWAGIRVPAPATPTPKPTQPPAPGIEFGVDRTRIRAGECVTFWWRVQNVQAVYFYAQGQPWQQSGVTGNESRQVCPGSTTTYELRVVKRDNSVEKRQIQIDVQQGGGVPVVYSFTVNPPWLALGDCVEIQWQVGGDVRNVTIFRHSRAIWENAPANAKLQDCPRQGGVKRYSVQARGPGGEAYAEDSVEVSERAPR